MRNIVMCLFPEENSRRQSRHLRVSETALTNIENPFGVILYFADLFHSQTATLHTKDITVVKW